MNDREHIMDVVNDLFIAVDLRDWNAVRRTLAPQVLFDMTSLAGGEPAILSRDDIIAQWDEGLRPMRAIHHQAGNYRVKVKGDTAIAFCYATAYHLLPEGSTARVRTFVGTYEYKLQRHGAGWLITSFRFNCKIVDPPL